jgi:hypothetical protein
LFLAKKGVPHAYSPVVFRGVNGPMTQAGGTAEKLDMRTMEHTTP